MNLKIQKLHPDAVVPGYATEGAFCFDLHAIIDNDIGADAIHPGCPYTFRTGLAIELPPGHGMLMLSRSGHGFKYGVRLANSTAAIDSDFRGEILVCLHNDNPDDAFVVHHGDRIAQALVLPVPRVTFEVSEQLSITDRGQGGFGSTGR